VNKDNNVVKNVIPAEGPSFGVAPSGICICTSYFSNKSLSILYSL
jgi:hypothetical protein